MAEEVPYKRRIMIKAHTKKKIKEKKNPDPLTAVFSGWHAVIVGTLARTSRAINHRS